MIAMRVTTVQSTIPFRVSPPVPVGEGSPHRGGHRSFRSRTAAQAWSARGPRRPGLRGDAAGADHSIGPLEGARFGLFPTNPGASIDDHDGFTNETPQYSCTSGRDGWCEFSVDVTELPDNNRLWLAATGSPVDAEGNPTRYANPQWQTGPLSPSGGDPLRSLRHTFQTPVLEAGQTYSSFGENRNWITDPGLLTDPPIVTPGADTTGAETDSNNYQRRIASGGVVPLSRRDPELTTDCGLKVALVVDLSSSVRDSVGDIKSALDSFVGSLQGTPSQAALFTFGTDSPANGYRANTGLLPVATANDNEAFRDLYAGWENPPTNYTNWDRGLGAVADANATHPADQRFDMAVVLTDGNPTVYGPNPTPNGQLDDRNSGYTRFRELGNATASANLLKSQGTRILAVGVGSGVDGPDAAYNLRTISGRDPYTGDNIREADYFQTDDYEAAGHALRDLVLANCAPSVSVVKQIVPHGGTTANAYPGTDWQFSASPTSGTVTPTTGRTDSTGAMNFDMEFDTETAGLHVTETQQTGYTSMPQETECVAKESGTDQPVPITQDPENPEAFTVEGVGLNSVVSCTVYNRAPDTDSASVTVDKQWEVTRTTGPDGETTTDTYAAGNQPAGLNSSLTLDSPDGAGADSPAWGDPREGYSVSEDGSVHVDENVTIQPSGCELTGTDIDGQAMTPGTGADMELASGANEWTVTNEVECHSRLRLNKNVASGDLGPQWWQLRAIGPDDALPGPNGRTTTDWAEVTPGATYQLAERADTPEPEGDAPHDVVHYVQNDQRTKDPDLEYPQSTGSWSCEIPGSQQGGGFSTDVEGAVTVPLGEDVECTATNQTADMSVTKQVQGGDAQPGDFTFRLTPLDPVPPGGHSHDLRSGQSQHVRPQQNYKVEEVNVPDGYRMVDLSCTTGPRRQVVDPSRWALEPGGTGQCTAVNRRMSELTVEKLDVDDGSTLPGAEFELYRDTDGDGTDGDGTDGTSQDAPDADDYRVDTCTSGGNGRCAIGDLDFGDYYWYEKSAPEGYSLPEDRTSDIVPIDADNAGEAHVTTFRDSRIPNPGPTTNPTEPTSTTGPPPGPGPSPSEGPDGPNGPDGPGGAGDGDGGGPHGTDGDGSNGLSDTGADVGVPFALGLAFLVGGAALAALARRKPGNS